jgi:hypothetical protein
LLERNHFANGVPPVPEIGVKARPHIASFVASWNRCTFRAITTLSLERRIGRSAPSL